MPETDTCDGVPGPADENICSGDRTGHGGLSVCRGFDRYGRGGELTGDVIEVLKHLLVICSMDE